MPFWHPAFKKTAVYSKIYKAEMIFTIVLLSALGVIFAIISHA